MIEGEILVPSETSDVALAPQEDKVKTHNSEENAV